MKAALEKEQQQLSTLYAKNAEIIRLLEEVEILTKNLADNRAELDALKATQDKKK